MGFSADTVDHAADPPARTTGVEGDGLERLVRLLARIRRRARAWVWIESLAWVLLFVAGFFWISLMLDRAIEPPAWVRGLGMFLAAATVAWILADKLLRRLAMPLSDASLALVVERGDPRFGDGLATAIDLATASAGPAHGKVDPALAARTISDAADLIGQVRPDDLFRGRRLLAVAGAGAVAAASVVGFALARPALATLWARRMVLLDDPSWPRRVTLTADGFSPDGERVVARGSDVEVVVRASATRPWPGMVELRSRGPDGWRRDRMGTRGAEGPEGRTFAHVLADVTRDTELEVRGGDARLPGLRLRVTDAPAVADVAISYREPTYLGGGRRHAAPARLVRIPRGSDVELRFTSTKPLSAAVLATRGMPDAVRATTDGEPFSHPRVLATLEAAADTTPRSLDATVPGLDGELPLILELTDTDGLTNREPITLTLSAIADEPPVVAIRPLGVPVAVTPAGRLLLVGTVVDDHGLDEAAVDVASGADPSRSLARIPIGRIRPGDPRIEFPRSSPWELDLTALGLEAGSRIGLTAVARDRCGVGGGPNEARGDTWTLEVVTPESLRALLEAREIMLRRRFESVIDDLARARDGLASDADRGREELTQAAAIGQPARSAERCGDAASRAAGETGEIAEAFRFIRLELANNGLLTAEGDTRLEGQIAVPLSELAETELPTLARGCREGERSVALGQADAALARMRELLARMLESESYHELVERLRGVIKLQESIRSDTLQEQKRRGREALGRP
jgi:hypothetical protein